MPSHRRFPPPWSVEEYNDACFIVRDQNAQKLAYIYFEEEPRRRSAAKLLTKDEARRDSGQRREAARAVAQGLIALKREAQGLSRAANFRTHFVNVVVAHATKLLREVVRDSNGQFKFKFAPLPARLGAMHYHSLKMGKMMLVNKCFKEILV